MPRRLSALLLAGACAWAAPAPARTVLPVPFFPDRTDQCGPSTLASLLSFWGKAIPPAQLRREMYMARLHGTLPMDLFLTARSHGLKAEMVRGDLEKLHSEL